MKTIRFLFVLLFMAQLLCMDAQNLQYGLKACYPFDSPGGTYEPNMAATGTALDAVPVNVTSVPGVTGTGYAFAGTPNSFIQLPNNAMIKPSNALSFSGWVKFNAVGTGQYIVFTHNTCTYYFEAYALVAGQVGSNFVFQVVKPGATACASQHILNGTTNLQPNTWYHVGFYVGTDAIKLYVNGVLESQMASTTSFNYGSNPVYLGGTNDVIANAPFGGIMDNVRFYDRMLTNAEFALLYSTNPPCNIGGLPLINDGLQACYPLDCNAANMAATGSALNGLMTSGLTCTTGVLGTANTALAFPGSPTEYVQLPNSPLLKPTGSNAQISFSAWVRFNTVSTSQYIVFAQNTCTSGWFEGYTLAGVTTGGGFKLQAVKAGPGCNTASQHVVTSSMSMGANTWYNVGFYMGTDSIKIYINGQLQGSMVSTSLFNYANTNVYLGGTNSSIYNLPFNGKMDNVRFYNRKLYNYEFNTLTNTTLDCGSAGTALLNGLQACYPFNCSPYNFAPTTTPNAPSLDANPVGVSCTTGHSGNANGAYKMWGVPTSYIELPNDSRIKPNAVSVSCWSKIDVLNPVQYIVFAKNPCYQYFEGYALVAVDAGNNQIKYQVTKSPGTGLCNATGGYVLSTGTYPAYSWNHVVFYMDGQVIKLYVNGQLAGTTIAGGALNYDATKVYIGGTNYASYNYPLNGCVDNVRFYNRELSSTEAYVLYAYDPDCDVTWICGGDPSNCKIAFPIDNPEMQQQAKETSIELYPNPNTGKFFVRNAGSKILQVYDINGRLIHHTMQQVDEKTSEIQLNTTAEGIYFVRILDANGQLLQTSKMVLAH